MFLAKVEHRHFVDQDSTLKPRTRTRDHRQHHHRHHHYHQRAAAAPVRELEAVVVVMVVVVVLMVLGMAVNTPWPLQLVGRGCGIRGGGALPNVGGGGFTGFAGTRAPKHSISTEHPHHVRSSRRGSNLIVTRFIPSLERRPDNI